MSVTTKVIINKGVALTEILQRLKVKYDSVEIITTGSDVYFIMRFIVGSQVRSISVFFGDYAKIDYGVDGTLLSLGAYGNSLEIMNFILAEFGGYIRKTDDDEFQPVNVEKFMVNKNVTKKDLFTLKVIQKVGYDKLDVVLDLFDEFKNLTD